MSEETLRYPKQIAPEIGLGVNEINAMKHLGCKFYGRKTSVRWVREYLEFRAAEKLVASKYAPALREDHQALAGSKSHV